MEVVRLVKATRLKCLTNDTALYRIWHNIACFFRLERCLGLGAYFLSFVLLTGPWLIDDFGKGFIGFYGLL